MTERARDAAPKDAPIEGEAGAISEERASRVARDAPEPRADEDVPDGERETDLPPAPSLPPPSGEARLSEPRACPTCARTNPIDARFCNGCGLGLLGDEPAHAPPGADPLVGRVIAGRYRIDEVIGRGGMGVVYRVEHVRMGKLMAVKLLHGELARDREVVRRFHREAEAVSKLDHPHTVQVFDFGESDGMTWLVMELLSGRDLGALLTSDGSLDFTRAARIVWQIASSVQQAHDRGIIHRDLKPENVRILSDRSEPDFVKVMDFGLAKLRDTEEQKRASITRDGFLVGTPYYMAPEHIRGEPVDARSDVYALGAMFYKMITGVPPFWASTPVAVLTKHLADQPIAPSRKSARRDLPPEADRIVLKALAKNPADRQQSMNELRDELAAFLDETTGKSPKSGRITAPQLAIATDSGRQVAIATRSDVDRFERTLRTQDVLGRLLLVALALVTAGVSWWAWGGERAPSAPTEESEPNDTATAADEVWLGTPLEGQLGLRISTTDSDADVYRVVGLRPDDHYLRIDASGLPNLDMAVDVFVLGRPDPLLVIDGAGLGAAERVPALPIDPSARYLVRVRESLTAGRYPTENLSDRYVLSLDRTTPADDEEREPNDGALHGEPIALGTPRTGYLGWPGDNDAFCLAEGAPRVSVAITGVAALDLVLVWTDRVTGAETRVDAAGLGEPEASLVESGNPFCVVVSADTSEGGRSDPDRSYELLLTE